MPSRLAYEPLNMKDVVQTHRAFRKRKAQPAWVTFVIGFMVGAGVGAYAAAVSREQHPAVREECTVVKAPVGAGCVTTTKA